MLVLILYIEELGDARAVVRHDEVAYDGRQVLALSQFHALRDVRDDDAGALLIRERVVRIDASLILGEEHGVLHLAYVVIERAGTHEQGVGSDLVGNLGGEVTHGDGVLEGAGGYLGEVAQQAAVGVGKLEERHARHESEHLLYDVHHRISDEQQHGVNDEVVIHVVVHA